MTHKPTSRTVAMLAAILLAASPLLPGCAVSPTGSGTQETVAKAEASVGAAYKVLNELFILGKVSKADALNYRARLVNAEDLLKQAEVAARSNDAATSNLASTAATAIINDVTLALAARKAAQ